MIKEERIQQAAKAFDMKTQFEKGEDWEVMIQLAFKAGAHWAIHESKKSLWHDVSEKPEIRKPILYIKSTGVKDVWCFPGGNWSRISEVIQVSKWMYIDDVLN